VGDGGSTTFAVSGPSVRLAMGLARASRAFAGIAIAIGLAVLVGYAVGSAPLVRLSPHLPPMYPITAVALAVGGIGAWCTRGRTRSERRISLVGAAALLAFGALDLLLHVIEADELWWFDVWPREAPVAATTPIAGRPVAETGLALALAGMAGVLTATHRAPRAAQGLAIGTVLVGASAALAYLLGVDRSDLGASPIAIGMALHTAVALVALGSAWLLSSPATGLLRVLTDAGPGGSFGRRLFLVALIAPIGLAATDAVALGWAEDHVLAASLVAPIHIAVLGMLVLIPVAAIERSTAASQELTELEARDREAASSGAVAERVLARFGSTSAAVPRGWEVAVRREAASGHAAGDATDLLPRRDGRFLVFVCDVAGHGVEPNLLALEIRAVLAALWRREEPLTALAAAANDLLVDAKSVATQVLVDLDPSTGAFGFVNAGHPPPVVCGHRGLRLLPATGPLLGLSGSTHRQDAGEIGPGEVLVLYTDGLTEAMDSHRQQLGEERVFQIIERVAPEGPTALAELCVAAARQHSGGRPRDDILVVALGRAQGS
jgi:hypothetical protein